jgi:hypothetical protein
MPSPTGTFYINIGLCTQDWRTVFPTHSEVKFPHKTGRTWSEEKVNPVKIWGGTDNVK